ncbi:MAG: polysaccharide biosynthesis tyrosine autokinase [Ferruginibacter sp.]
MEEIDNEMFGDAAVKKTGLTLKDQIRKYLAYWPVFILSMAIFIGGAMLYLRKATPKYIAKTLILVKGERPNPSGMGDVVNAATIGFRSSNMENELQLMRSIGLMESIVAQNQFNVSYYLLGKIKSSDLYLNAPFRLIVQKISDSASGFSIIVKDLSNAGARIEYGPKTKKKGSFLNWNTPYTINGQQFVLAPRGKNVGGEGDYMAIWSPVRQTAQEIAGKITVDWLDKKTSIIQLTILIESLQRGRDILNALAKEYDRKNLEDKTIASRNTIQFIDDRLAIMSRELSGVEGSLESYQGQNQLVNVTTQSGEAFANSSSVSKEINDISIKKGVIQQIQSYFNNTENPSKLVPSSLGIEDPTLGSLISKYNELESTKQREKPRLSSNSIVLKDLDNQINDVKGSVLESLQNINKNLNAQQNSLQQTNNQYKQFLSSLPRKEREMQEIKRKQSITEGLYLYLLQKREEASIAAGSANISIYRQVDSAVGYGPVEPNSRNIMLVSIILGLLMPIGLIVLLDQLNDKVISREDVTSKLAIPVLGEIVHVPKRKAIGILVMNRDLLGEQFRLIRTNLALSERDNPNKVILITSSNIGEGKSTVSLNLSAVLAVTGKKVALLEFDMRKPGITKGLGMSKDKGLSDYLVGQTTDLSEIYQVSEEIPSLHIYPAGPIPANPADLLLNEYVAPLFEALRRKYDFVIVDTAPVGLVTDAFILNNYCDTSIYLIRQRHTLKRQLDFVKDIYANGRLKNLALIINDVKTGGKYGSGYGYGEKYTYVYGHDSKKNWWNRIFQSRQAEKVS